MIKQTEEKKVLGLTKKQRSHLYTTLFVIVFLIFFFVNNDFEGAKEGPYPPNYEAKVNPESRTAAPAFELTSIKDETIFLSELRGKVVLLNFWTSWSEPCRKAIPDLIELRNNYNNRDFEIVGIALDTDTRENVPQVVEQTNINYPVVYGDMNTAQSYGDIRSIPTFFILDKKGRIFSSYVGEVSKKVYKNDIDKLLEE